MEKNFFKHGIYSKRCLNSLSIITSRNQRKLEICGREISSGYTLKDSLEMTPPKYSDGRMELESVTWAGWSSGWVPTAFPISTVQVVEKSPFQITPDLIHPSVSRWQGTVRAKDDLCHFSLSCSC